MFISLNSISDMKQGLIGSKTRSPGQILEKLCVHLRGHSFKCNLHETLSECLSHLHLGQDLKLGHVRSKTRS